MPSMLWGEIMKRKAKMKSYAESLRVAHRALERGKVLTSAGAPCPRRSQRETETSSENKR